MIIGDDNMKKIIILVILIMAIINCSYFEGAERAERERGLECLYNGRGEIIGCNYMRQK